MKRSFLVAAVLITLASTNIAYAQRGGRGARGDGQQGQRGARTTAPADLTGYWVSVISEDWKFRMVTPPRGQYGNVPMSAEGRRIADTWDPAKDEAAGAQCKAYGAAGVMRLPGRLHITWENDNVLRIDTDAGTQTRRLVFSGGAPPAGDAGWQGQTTAEWQTAGGRGTRFTEGGQSEAGGFMKAVTTKMRPGYLRKNGVPYGENAVMTEYFERHLGPNGEQYLVVTAVIEDPQFLNGAYLSSANFKKLPNDEGWKPAPCSAR
jgi:hypothetical protein